MTGSPIPRSALAERDRLRADLNPGAWHTRVLDLDKVDPPCRGEVEHCDECEVGHPEDPRYTCPGCEGRGWVVR